MPDKWGNKLPNTVKDNIGSTKIEKGRWQGSSTDKKKGKEDFYLVAWDFAYDCTYEDCVLFDKCEYVKKKVMQRENRNPKYIPFSKKCLMQQRYLRNIIYSFVEKMQYAKKLEQECVIKLGFHLIPLYAHLFKFKVLEQTNSEILMTTARGDQKINPIYKEIREIIKTITSVWKDIGSSARMQMDTKNVGDSAFIDAMYSSELLEESEEQEETSDKGEAWDFDEETGESGELEEEGEGLDIEKYNTVETGGRVQKKNLSYLERSSTKTKKDKKRKRKKKPKKEKVEVLSYTDPRRIEMRKKEREAAEAIPNKRKRKRKNTDAEN